MPSQGFASFVSFLTTPDHPFQGVAPNCPFLDAPSLLNLKPKAASPLNLAHSSHPGQTSCTHTQNHNPSSIFFYFLFFIFFKVQSSGTYQKMTRSRVWRGRQPRKWPHLIEQRILHKKLHRCKVVKSRLRADNSFDKNSKQLSQGSPTLTLYLYCFCQKGGKRNFVHSKSRKLNRERS